MKIRPNQNMPKDQEYLQKRPRTQPLKGQNGISNGRLLGSQRRHQNQRQNWRYQMKRNLQKYVFGVESGKFLGFMVIHRGVCSQLEKNPSNQKHERTQTLNNIHELNGRLAALRNFLSKGGDRSIQFLKQLRGYFQRRRQLSKRKQYVIKIASMLSSN